jgi:hypothetical protein
MNVLNCEWSGKNYYFEKFIFFFCRSTVQNFQNVEIYSLLNLGRKFFSITTIYPCHIFSKLKKFQKKEFMQPSLKHKKYNTWKLFIGPNIRNFDSLLCAICHFQACQNFWHENSILYKYFITL